MGHIVLLGDSIFDNAAYTAGGPDVIAQLREILPRGWTASLLAVDGSVTDDVARQLARVPADASHYVLSCGGNDALAHIDILNRPASSVAQVLGMLADIAGRFATRYRAAITLLKRRKLPLTLCTIYDGSFPDPVYQKLASTALVVFNDVIVRVALEEKLSLIDLRAICRAPEDYANPIEPSAVGGAKIARAIAEAAVR